MRVEFRPLGDTVNVDLYAGLRERLEVDPAPIGKSCVTVVERKAPTLEIRMRRRSGRQYWKTAGKILPRRQSVSVAVWPAATETARDWRLSHGISLRCCISQFEANEQTKDCRGSYCFC